MRFKGFWREKGGNFGLMLALTLPPIFFAVDFAVDLSRLVNARATLQAATDSAVLAASHLKNEGMSREEMFQSFLEANVASNTDIIDVEGDIDVNSGLNHIRTRAQATATVDIGFLNYLGYSGDITVFSGAYEATDTLEVAMVLDNTGSMGTARTKALRSAATALVDILENTKSPSREVKAALIPFVSVVNINGEGFDESWIDTTGIAPYNGVNFEKKSDGGPYDHWGLFETMGVEWKGCVEARPAPYNISDDAPTNSNPSTLFVPYLAPDNPGNAGKSPNKGDKWNNSYLAGPADNTSEAQKTIARYLDSSTARYIRDDYIGDYGARTTGPNYACPTPVQPLTDDFDKLRTAIGQMLYWEGGGTNVSEGLAWGMRVLSPGEPYTQGAAFENESVSKVVVVFTDGENTVFGASSEDFNTSDYGAYSFLDSGRFGTTSRSKALTNVNTWTQTMCTNLKDKGVKVFAVLLGADTPANRKLYSACASSPGYYFPTSDVSELQSIFSRIGSEVAQLYLTN